MAIQLDPETTEVQFLHKYAKLKNACVLEIGCGSGRMTWRYGDTARQVVGVDTNATYLETALEERPQNLTRKSLFLQAFAEKLPFPPEAFDSILFAWSF